MEVIDQNEIRDYLNRAPKRWRFEGGRMVNTMHARLKWLSQIAAGPLDDRINRRAGKPERWEAWKKPVGSSIRRHARRQAVIKWGRR